MDGWMDGWLGKWMDMTDGGREAVEGSGRGSLRRQPAQPWAVDDAGHHARGGELLVFLPVHMLGSTHVPVRAWDVTTSPPLKSYESTCLGSSLPAPLDRPNPPNSPPNRLTTAPTSMPPHGGFCTATTCTCATAPPSLEPKHLKSNI
eukprot:210949-Chlamydomonas_euryale.AAC.2